MLFNTCPASSLARTTFDFLPQHHNSFIIATKVATSPSVRLTGFQIAPLSVTSLSTITVSRLFSDKDGAAPQALHSEDSTHSSTRQSSLLHRLHIRTSVRKSKSPDAPARPGSSASNYGFLRSRSSSRNSAPSSHSDAATIAEISENMPQSLTLNTPPSSSVKRQRSQDSRHQPSRPGSAGQNESKADMDGSVTAPESKTSIRIPPYLNKTESGKMLMDDE